MRRLIRVALFPLAQSLISLGNMDVPGSVLGSARVSRVMPVRLGLSASRGNRLFVDCAAEGKIRHDETPPVRDGVRVSARTHDYFPRSKLARRSGITCRACLTAP